MLRASNFVLRKFLNNMSNVLPKEALQAEWNKFRNRAVLVGALVLLGTAALSALTLLPAHVALEVEKTIAAGDSAAESAAPSGADQQAKSERSDVARARALLDGITPVVSATSSPTEVISAALAVRPSGVRIERITLVSGDKRTITIDGVSRGREDINQYKEALSKSGRFKSVSVPVGALVGAEGGKFTITLSDTL